jgi:CP family cyanate transporter-like MFS transporter
LLLVLVAVNLRPAVVVVGPLLPEIRAEYGLSGAAAGALTTLPLLFFGFYGLVAPFLRRSPRSETLLVSSMALLAAALLLRLVDAPVALYAGSLAAGIAISIGNIAMPAIIKRDHPGSIAPVTAVYTVAITASSALAAAAAIPIEQIMGGGWRVPLALLAAPAAIAGLVWLPRMRHPAAHAADHHDQAHTPPRGLARTVWRSGLAWHVTFFMGTQSLLGYVVIGWLATILQDRGMSAEASGYVFALCALLQAAGSLSMPLLARRLRDQRPLAATGVSLTFVGFAGIAWAPVASAWLWACFLGIGQGSLFALALALIGLRAHDARVAVYLSGMAQGCGYVVAALGPLAVGVLHDATGGWDAPVIVVLVITAMLTIPGHVAGRNRTISLVVGTPSSEVPEDDSVRLPHSVKMSGDPPS